MTKKEAIKAMLDGNKVSHRYFDKNEYIYMDDNLCLTDECGYALDWDEFWHIRSNDNKNKDWSIYGEIRKH